MARKAIPQPLTLANPQVVNEDADNQNPKATSRLPLSPTTPKTPRSPFNFTTFAKKLPGEEPSTQSSEPPRSTLPQTSASLSDIGSGQGERGQGERRPGRSGFFSNYKASKSSSRLQNSESSRTVPEEDMSKDADYPSMPGQVSSREAPGTESHNEKPVGRRPVGGSSKSDIPADYSVEQPPPPSSHSNTSTTQQKKSKPKPFSILSRTKTSKDEESPTGDMEHPEAAHLDKESLKTAPLLAEGGDRSFRAMMVSSVRQHSADRVPSASRDRSREHREKTRLKDQGGMGMRASQTTANLGKSEHTRNPTTSSTSNGGHSLFSSIKSQTSRGVGSLGKSLFGKNSRSGSSTERDVVTDAQYQLKVLNLPLVQQTRLTRISKKLEDSRDKTEFWMPAFPWRAIDYLNFKGSEVEGLYRVPGSTPDIKMWTRRFDEKLDFDLFEAEDLYDINIIGSMLKTWFRELPDELIPKDIQAKIIANNLHNGTEQEVPQDLIDALSALSPFRYYLLFAITCHLSLLLAHEDKNKMSYQNLAICFQPCMKIENFLFNFLVRKWRDCWKGCKTEAYFVDQEYALFENPNAFDNAGRDSTAVESHDERDDYHERGRNISSSDSSKPGSVEQSKGYQNHNANGNGYAKSSNAVPGSQNMKLPLSESQNASSSSKTAINFVSERNERSEQSRRYLVTPPEKTGDGGRAPQVGELRPLSPIGPMSPIGL